jgi:hypothetical protein
MSATAPFAPSSAFGKPDMTWRPDSHDESGSSPAFSCAPVKTFAAGVVGAGVVGGTVVTGADVAALVVGVVLVGDTGPADVTVAVVDVPQAETVRATAARPTPNILNELNELMPETPRIAPTPRDPNLD